MNEELPENLTTLVSTLLTAERLRAVEILLGTPGDLGEILREELTAYQERAARQNAIEVLLAAPDDISDPLEAELYAFRDHVNGIQAPGERPATQIGGEI